MTNMLRIRFLPPCSAVILPFLYLLLAISPVFQLKAQQEDEADACTQAFITAQRLYNEGQLFQVAGVLQGCLERSASRRSGVQQKFESREQQIEAYRLLILSYLYTDQSDKADQTMLALLRYEKEFRPVKSDPAEFIRLYRAFRTTPVLTVGPEIGVNTTSVVSLRPFGVNNLEQGSTTTYEPITTLQLGVSAELYLLRSFQLVTGARLQQYSFALTNPLFPYTTLNGEETHTWLGLPFLVRYTIGKGRFRPYIQVGGSWMNMLGANLQLSRGFTDPNTPFPEVTGPVLSVADQRINQTFATEAGGGVKAKIRGAFVSLELRHQWLYAQMVRSEQRYANQEMLFRYGYVSDDFRMTNWTATLMYQFAVYNPVKTRKTVPIPKNR